jgi:hypothetical protein
VEPLPAFATAATVDAMAAEGREDRQTVLTGGDVHSCVFSVRALAPAKHVVLGDLVIVWSRSGCVRLSV